MKLNCYLLRNGFFSPVNNCIVLITSRTSSGGSRNVRKGGARMWPNLLLLGVWGRCKPSNGVLGRAPQANAGMPNLRKNLFSTDFYRLFQSMDKEIIYGRIYGFLLTRFGHYPPSPFALPRSQYYTEKNDCWTNLRICSYCVRLLPPHDFARAE